MCMLHSISEDRIISSIQFYAGSRKVNVVFPPTMVLDSQGSNPEGNDRKIFGSLHLFRPKIWPQIFQAWNSIILKNNKFELLPAAHPP